METVLFIVIILLLSVLIYFTTQRKAPEIDTDKLLLQFQTKVSESSNSYRKEVQDRLDQVHGELAKSLRHSQSEMREQGTRVADTIQKITKELSEVKQTSKQVLDYSAELRGLQDILKNPKQRGVLGEYWLETLLSNVLPSKELYSMQYHIGRDENLEQKLIADAAIFVDQQIIPIDAKFSLENYNRMMEEHDKQRREQLEKQFKADVKKRIDETSKYIKPELGTTDFAFMFIPAEGVYYNLLNAEVGSGVNSEHLVEYAFKKHVMIVSPTSFYAYLQTVIMGLKKLEIEKSTQEIIKRVGELGKHFRRYAEYHGKLGNNLQTVVNQYNTTGDELKKISKDVMRITEGSKEDLIETEAISKPQLG
jgi:DNA recombination protein RmuC